MASSFRVFSVACLCVSAIACVPLGGFEFELEPQGPQGPQPLLRGPDVTRQGWEQILLDTPCNRTARKNLRRYASTAHMAGTAEDLEMAEFTRDKIRSYGLDAVIKPMDALLQFPVSRSLDLLDAAGRVKFKAPLIEDEISEDPTSGTQWRNMSFLAYAASGLATSQVVYANYGRPEDFDVLEQQGINVTGRIVLARYGECFRGLKVMNSQDRGAAAVLIYSDPADDGYTVGKTYPDGPWRPATSVQRGSVQFNSLCAGDPRRAASKLSPEEICGHAEDDLIPSIPAIPLSYHDALPILKDLGGPTAPASFRGTLPVTYRLGPSEGKVRLFVNSTKVVSPIWNVITTIPGSLSAADDQPVVVGNHRDAWVFGAADPNAGSSVMLEVAKSLGALLKAGWRPQRTIILASWSGEEYGLLGSTGWAESEADGVLKRASVYINTDVGVSGTMFKAAASPSVGRSLVRALAKVNDPVTGEPMDKVWTGKLGTLGSGSDYTVFLDHLGIASCDLSFAQNITGFGAYPYGVYHSIYDSYTWIEKEADPLFLYHVTLAKIINLLVFDFADSDQIPINLADTGKALQSYVAAVRDSHHHAAVDFSPLMVAANAYLNAAVAFHGSDASARSSRNDILGTAERSFLDKQGLPRRKWFKHILQAPGFYLGYAAKVFPGIDDALENNDLESARDLIRKAAALIQDAAAKISGALASQSMLETLQ
ncbi:Probable glutamate carboxypeptidase ARB_02390 [Durusdinium trenchii]|uniref:Probable glutamate carboxypeptidase ARB_02390 n=1 Tax=Durusdinium trenchii TaxID=1381693 RepID=A0ABP0RZE3_9DINO